MRIRLWLMCVGSLTVACSSGPRSIGEVPPGTDGGGVATDPDGSTTPVPVGGLRLEPADQERDITDGDVTIAYRAFLVLDGGAEEEVTSEAEFWISPATLGSFEGPSLTTDHTGGMGIVYASARGAQGSTGLRLRLETVVIGPGADESAPERFDGATVEASQAPTLVYPNDGVMVPPNLNELELHFLPNGNDLFELHMQAGTLDLRVYFTCQTVGAGCGYTPDADVWRLISESGRGGDPVTYRVRGVASSSPGTVGVSEDREISFAAENVTGGLYYWNAGAGAIRRYDFGRRGQTAENYMDAARAGASTCVGCHTLSRDGTRIAVGMDIPSPAPFKVFDTATRTEIFQKGSTFGGGGANYFSFSPDATQLLASNGISIELLNADTGDKLADLTDSGTMPDWSPDGNRIVFARSGSTPPCFGSFCSASAAISASIESMVRSADSWLSGPTLVPFTGANNFHPSHSPDGEWILFTRSPSNLDSMPGRDEVTDFELWIVPSGGGNEIRLTTTNEVDDSWAKWDPTAYEHQGHPLFWFTFASRRPYGLRNPSGGRSQIWMAAFDPTRPDDPSLPAFWLPFQEPGTANHIAQWVTSIERQGCSGDGGCGTGEFCSDDGACLPEGPF